MTNDCDYAGPRHPGDREVAGWWFCAEHAAAHETEDISVVVIDTPAAAVAKGRPSTSRAVCGSVGGHAKHTRERTEPCQPCRKAHARSVADSKKRAKARKFQAPQQLAPCGTRSAYARHIDRGEPACDPCRKAAQQYERERRARRAA